MEKQTQAIRIGVIGTSPFTDAYHHTLLSGLPEAELTAVCGRNEERAREISEKHGIPHVFTDYRTMLESGLLDGVVIASPDDLHYPMTMLAIENGLHVLCEKPLALNARQAQEMRDAAEAGERVTLVNHIWRWRPAYRYAHQLLNEGYIGDLMRAEFHYLAGYGRNKSNVWRFDAARAGGVLGDLGSHMIDLARYLVGDISDVTARLETCVPLPDDGPGAYLEASNDLASLSVGFENGATANIVATNVDYRKGQVQHVELFGTEGTLDIEMQISGARIRATRGDDYEQEVLEVPAELGGNPARSEMEEYYNSHDIGPRLFLKAIAGQAVAEPNFDDGFRIQQVIDAAIESHRSGKRVAIPSTDTD